MFYDKELIKEQLNLENIYSLLEEWGGEPEYTNIGIISSTICHNPPHEGSRKLYYYENSNLFHCYTGCENSSFDIFELVIKVMSIQKRLNWNLTDAMRFIAGKFNLSDIELENTEEDGLQDWEYLKKYNRIQHLDIKNNIIVLEEYDRNILNNFNYSLKITPWLNEGISEEAMKHAHIGYFPGTDQITIPHYDKDGRFIGLRGRTVCEEEANLYGKYRPIFVNGIIYKHPLGLNLYNLNNSKENIELIKKAIVVESEKACLQYQSYFGIENDITVACCGSSFTNHQGRLLIDLGVSEIIFAFDRQFQKIGDDEFLKLKKKLLKLYMQYKNYTNISFIFDKNMILQYKNSPLDEGKDKFLQLFQERILM